MNWTPDLNILAGSNFAGDLTTRGWTSGIMAQFGSHTIKHSSSFGRSWALCGGEGHVAHFYVTGMSGWRSKFTPIVSLAVLGTAKPTSELDYMRSFVIVSSGCWKLKVSTQSNLADVSTKPMAWETLSKHMQAMHFEIVEGRTRSANGLRFAPSALMSALWQKDAAVQERWTNVQFFARRCVHVSTCDANCCLAPVK